MIFDYSKKITVFMCLLLLYIADVSAKAFVDVEDGQLKVHKIDYYTKVNGDVFSLERSYLPQSSQRENFFGKNWCSNFEKKLELKNGNAEIYACSELEFLLGQAKEEYLWVSSANPRIRLRKVDKKYVLEGAFEHPLYFQNGKLVQIGPMKYVKENGVHSFIGANKRISFQKKGAEISLVEVPRGVAKFYLSPNRLKVVKNGKISERYQYGEDGKIKSAEVQRYKFEYFYDETGRVTQVKENKSKCVEHISYKKVKSGEQVVSRQLCPKQKPLVKKYLVEKNSKGLVSSVSREKNKEKSKVSFDNNNQVAKYERNGEQKLKIFRKNNILSIEKKGKRKIQVLASNKQCKKPTILKVGVKKVESWDLKYNSHCELVEFSRDQEKLVLKKGDNFFVVKSPFHKSEFRDGKWKDLWKKGISPIFKKMYALKWRINYNKAKEYEKLDF